MCAHARNAPVVRLAALEEGPGIEMEDQQSEGRHLTATCRPQRQLVVEEWWWWWWWAFLRFSYLD
jgi:hypothetical protein